MESWIDTAINNVYLLINSPFSVAFIGSLSGALGGALGAQRIIEMLKRRDGLAQEIKNVNAAIVVSFSICNTFIALKKQHILPITRAYDDSLKALETFNTRRELGELNEREYFEYEADFKTIGAPSIPLESLKDIVFDRIGSGARVISAVSEIGVSAEAFSDVLVRREKVIGRMRAQNREEQACSYFGVVRPDGHVDQEYADLLDGMSQYSDDVIFFTSLLCEDLMEYGESIVRNNARVKKHLPSVNDVNFSGKKAKPFMPERENYLGWLEAFKYEAPSRTVV